MNANRVASYMMIFAIPTPNSYLRASAPNNLEKTMKTLKEKMPRESTVENYLVDQVKLLGGKTLKLAGGEPGTPDRLVAIPGHPPFMVECKRPSGPGPKKQQRERAAEWESAGIDVFVCHTKGDVDHVL